MTKKTLLTRVSWAWLWLALALVLNGCTAVHTSLAKGKLDAQTRMTHTIFLDPVEPAQRSIYLDIRQTADQPLEGLQTAVHNLLLERGYQLVESPSDAQFWLQVNLRTVRKAHPRELLTQGEFAMTHAEIEQLLDPGARPKAPFEPRVPNGPPQPNTATNAFIYADLVDDDLDISGKDLRRALIAVAIIAGAEYAGRQMVKDVYYTMITDIQVAERVSPDSIALVEERSWQRLNQGDSGSADLLWERATDRRKYQARVISYANKANLKWEQAEASLYEGLVRSLAGIF